MDKGAQGARRLVRRGLAISAIGAVVAVIAPAAPRAERLVDVSRWAGTAIPQAALTTAGKGFPVSTLSSDGRVAVVGNTRAVYVFRANSEGSWGSISKPMARLRLPSSALANLSAMAVSSDGTTVLVAAGAVGNSRAAAYVFHVSSPQAWRSSVAPTAKLTNASERIGFGSGVALSSDGRTALVGELEGADVFHVAAADSWRRSSTPTAILVAQGGAEGGLGISVALSADGTTALIGATNLYTSVGAAYIFRAAGADAWVSKAAPDAVLTDGVAGPFGDGFGAAVALSPDGMTALVGAPNLAFGPGGAAFLFHVRRPDAWTSTASPDAAVDRVPVQFGRGGAGKVPGWSVALSGEGTALVGAPALLGSSGSADIFHVAGSDWPWGAGSISHARLTNAASPPADLFGGAVGISADGATALVSSARGTFVFTRAGSQGATYCYVPYLKGMALPAANRAIEANHCGVGKVTRVSSPVRSRRVIAQRPEPGERLARGAKIDLVFSRGS